ncbi:hypothetical protein NDU88_000639 [Pleurodeles waltl]|uniref:BHLH domain-containing protein n=1 Tax=Pleurodeles waltl TaxID=8319 RepID=A0AAV7N8G7_PLEWA|nr:hypothetical protein NDU88_000639 [Pleurodeles waltl]
MFGPLLPGKMRVKCESGKVASSEAMPELSENETPTKIKHRKKKNRESHNAVERHRKTKINSGINRIGELIPCSPILKQSKNMILDQAFKYITELKRQNDELLLNGGDKEQADEILRLRKQLSDIQKENARYIELLKANDICLYDDPTIHWKGNLKNAKVPLNIPAESQKNIIVYSNGSPLGVNNQSVSFNVNQNLQKQTANVVPVQRTCNTVTPATVASVLTTKTEVWPQSTVGTSTSHQQIPLCLPVTIPAQAILKISTSEGEPNILHAVTNSQDVLQSGTADQLHCVSRGAPQSNRTVLESKVGQQNGSVAEIVAPQATNTPVFPQESSSLSASCSGFQESFVVTITKATPEQCSQATVAGNFQSTSVNPLVDVTSSSRMLATSAVAETAGINTLLATTTSTLPASCLDSGWSLPSSLPGSGITADFISSSSLTRIPATGNTQTTWTTLQVAGNTVQPLSRVAHSNLSALSNEPVSDTGSVPSTSSIQTITGVRLNNTPQVEGHLSEQVIVTLPSCPSLTVQPLVASSQIKPQPAKSIVPLNPAMQVFQMAPPIGSAVTAAPANQNVIILHPPNPLPCPPVIRAEVPTQAVGQQIVIIQAAPNPSPLPLLSTQTPGPARLPAQAPGPLVSTNSPVHSAPAQQIFGSKHLVHILPRPSNTSSTSGSTPSFSVTMSSAQQPPTISLNGQLFALQPMMSSSGAAQQTPLQFIQPTTSEDPNTNVALNTFGALASLSQSISQTAGQSCVQMSINQASNPSAPASSSATPTHCIPLATTATSSLTSEKLPTLLSTSNTAKPSAGLSATVKCKRINRKTSTKKRPSSSKEVPQLSKGEDTSTPDPASLESSKTISNTENPNPLDSTSPTAQSPSGCHLSTVGSVTGVSNSDHNSVESSNSELLVGSISEGHLHTSTLHSPLFLKPSGKEQFVLSTSVCKDPILLAKETLEREVESQPGSSLQAECSKPCIPVSCSTPSNTINLILATPLSEPSIDQSSSNMSSSPVVVNISEPNINRQDHSSIMQAASDLLEGQGLGTMLYEIAKEKSSTSQTVPQVQSELQHLPTANLKPKDSDDDGFPAKIMNSETENINLEHSCVAEQEVVVSTSLVHSRQADSPMSTSSGSNHSFSVASMLPDTSREEVTNSASLSHVFSVCTSSEQNDIVALAAQAIFEQGNAEKKKAATRVDLRAMPLEATEDASAGGNVPTLTPTYSEKSREQFETQKDKTHFQGSMRPTDVGGSVESPNCSVHVETSNILLQTAAQNTSSLSINNLIHSDNVDHSFASCSNSSQPSEQMATTTTVNLPRPLVSYDNQSPAPALATEYSHEHIHAFRASVMQSSQAQEINEEQNCESRKETSKRPVQEDHHLSTAKRQKQCESAPIRHDRMSSVRGNSDDFVEQAQMLVGQMSHNSSNSVVSVSSHAPTNSFNSLFQTNVTFVNSALRQTDIRPNSLSVLTDHQQGQSHNQHLQQRISGQPVNHLHNSNPYLKQQQSGQLRDRPHLYQQHHNPHADSTIHSQSHSAHQQRAMQQDVQMQKKRNVGQGSQANPLSLQQKHHASDQGRPKGNHAHPHHHQQMQQQMQQHFTASQGEKNCDNSAGSRNHHGAHQQNHLNPDILHQQEVGNRQQSTGSSSDQVTTHNQLQRLMTSRSLEQHMVSQPSIVSRQSNMTCTPHRQERNRVSSYSAEALIGKTSNSEQRMGLSIQGPRLPDQLEMRTYLEVSRTKGLPVHNMQNRIPMEHAVPADVQRVSDCQSYKTGSSNHQATGTFELQTSRNSEIGNTIVSLRGMQSQTFRLGQNSVPAVDRQKRLPYAPVQGIPIANAMPPIENSCHQSFMQSLLGPHLGETVVGSQRLISEHQRNTQCGVSTTLEYSCPTGRESVHLRRDSESQNRESCDMSMGVINSRNNSLTIPFSSSSSSGEVQGRNTSPHISVQKSNPMRITESQGSKSQLHTNVSSNVHGIARPSHPTISHGNADQGQTSVRQSNPPMTQRSRHPLQDNSNSKVRPAERSRSNNQRHGNVFDPSLPHLPLAPSSSMILGRQPSSVEKRASIVRFMSDGSQVPNDNTGPDQHALSQNFGFPFIPDGIEENALAILKDVPAEHLGDPEDLLGVEKQEDVCLCDLPAAQPTPSPETVLERVRIQGDGGRLPSAEHQLSHQNHSLGLECDFGF